MRYLVHPQSLAQSGIYLQIWANGELKDQGKEEIGQYHPHSLRDTLVSELALLGDYPQKLRKVAIANGSGYGNGQDYAPGTRLLNFSLCKLINCAILVYGRIWAAPDYIQGAVFEGKVDQFGLSKDKSYRLHQAKDTPAFDTIPGSTRSTIKDIYEGLNLSEGLKDAGKSIVSEIHPFMPTISALDIRWPTTVQQRIPLAVPEVPLDENLSVSNIKDMTPFDAIYFSNVNRPHESLTVEAAQWLLAQIEQDNAAEGFSFEDFRPPAPSLMTTNGDAAFTESVLRLTPDRCRSHTEAAN